jgi:hypothetical protein
MIPKSFNKVAMAAHSDATSTGWVGAKIKISILTAAPTEVINAQFKEAV